MKEGWWFFNGWEVAIVIEEKLVGQKISSASPSWRRVYCHCTKATSIESMRTQKLSVTKNSKNRSLEEHSFHNSFRNSWMKNRTSKSQLYLREKWVNFESKFRHSYFNVWNPKLVIYLKTTFKLLKIGHEMLFQVSKWNSTPVLERTVRFPERFLASERKDFMLQTTDNFQCLKFVKHTIDKGIFPMKRVSFFVKCDLEMEINDRN